MFSTKIYNQYIKNLSIYTEDPYINNIIKICDLEPTDDWKIWLDDNGNRIVANDKKTKIEISSKIIKNTKDILAKTTPDHIAQNSQYLILSRSKNKHLIWFYGNDGLLRLCYFINMIHVSNKPILLSGISNLRIISRKINKRKNIKIHLKEIKKLRFNPDYSFGISLNQLNDFNLKEIEKICLTVV